MPPRPQDGLQRAAGQVGLQPAFEQREDGDPGQGGIDGKFRRSTDAHDQRAGRRDPVGFSALPSDALSQVPAGLGVTPMQVALAWLLHRAPNILLIRGAFSVGHLRENLAAAELKFSAEVVVVLDGIGAEAAH